MRRALHLAALGLALAATTAYAEDVSVATTFGEATVSADSSGQATAAVRIGGVAAKAAANDQGQVDAAVSGDATQAVEEAAGVVAPPEGGGRPHVDSPVVGYIQIVSDGVTAPTWTPHGALADPTRWTCGGGGGGGSAYSVTCYPQPDIVLTWKCDVLHADASGLAPESLLNTSMDCTGDGAPEAQSGEVAGVDHGYEFATANIALSSFTCTVDSSLGGPRGPFNAGCGDPGVPTVERG